VVIVSDRVKDFSMDLVQTPRTIAASSATPESADALRPRRSKGLVNEVVESLAASIREGAIKPGDKLPTVWWRPATV